MFRISVKGIYGLSAVLELAFRYTAGPVLIRDIADAQNIPQHYLEQILVVLKRGGIVSSYRGARGGYTLARDPSLISLHEVLVLLEGPIDIAHETRGNNRLSLLWNELEDAIRKPLKQSLADLASTICKQEGHLDYSI